MIQDYRVYLAIMAPRDPLDPQDVWGRKERSGTLVYQVLANKALLVGLALQESLASGGLQALLAPLDIQGRQGAMAKKV